MYLMVTTLASVTMIAMMLLCSPTEAIIYCNGSIAVDEMIINGSYIYSEGENCSRLGLECTDGIGCEPPEVYQFPVIGIVIVFLVFIIAIALKRRRR
jgi:hypothetical protein